MASPKTEWSVGAFILMGFACALALAFASTNSGERMGGDSYRVTARFTNAGDLKARAPVKIAGVKVGEIESIVLDPASFDAVATLRLAKSVELPMDTGASIFTSGLLGERYVGLDPGGDPDILKDGDELMLTQPAVVLEQLIGKYMFGSADGSDAGGAATPSETQP